MEQDAFTLLVTLALGAIAALLTIIAVATPEWPGKLFNCGNVCPYGATTAGVLLIISIVLLTVAVVFTVMFWRGLISNASDKVKGIVLALFILSAILIIIAYSRAIPSRFYSYHLAITAGILAFLSSIFFTYWLGRTSVTFTH